jgi:ABC-2 type transport system ATP-binding protein
MEPALSLQRLRKTFGGTTAVDDIDLDVPRGALYGVIGPNGAGKTTCIRMIMAILFPDSGGLSVLDAKDLRSRLCCRVRRHRRGGQRDA